MLDKIKKFFNQEVKNPFKKVEKGFIGYVQRQDIEEENLEVRRYNMATEDDMNQSLADIAFASEQEQKRLLKEVQSSISAETILVPSTNSEERYKRLDAIHDKLNQERVEARRLTKEGDVKQAAVQWDIVEELSAEASDRSAYEKFCDENPDNHNCRMYDV